MPTQVANDESKHYSESGTSIPEESEYYILEKLNCDTYSKILIILLKMSSRII